jgi:hydroxylamine dehydrogenase
MWRHTRILVLGVSVGIGLYGGWSRANAKTPAGDQCVECHTKTTPNVVNDWKLSKHAEAGIGCDACHGSDHVSNTDASKAKIPTPEICGQCHDTQVRQFKKGKHAIAWAAMEAMPTIEGVRGLPQDRLEIARADSDSGKDSNALWQCLL